MDERSSRLRPVPGYGPAPETPAGGSAPGAGGAQEARHLMQQPYVARERLYYEGETAAAGLAAPPGREQPGAAPPAERPAPAVPTGVLARLADDAPPTLMLHEAVMTPDRRHADAEPAAPVPEALMLGGGLPSGGLATSENANSDADEPGDLEDNWVTVYGFAPGQGAAVLAYFSRLGGAVRSVPGQGAWLHVCYASRWEAQRALAKNVSVVPSAAPGALLGVVPMRRALAAINAAADSLTSPLAPEAVPADAPGDAAAKRPASVFARPDADAATPDARGDSVLSRAFGVVFGW